MLVNAYRHMMLLNCTVCEKLKMLIFKDQHIITTKSVNKPNEPLRSEC